MARSPGHGHDPSAAAVAEPEPRGWVAAAGAGAGEAAAGESLGLSFEARMRQSLEHEVTDDELAKWSEMLNQGVVSYRAAHPDRFHRRVRRGIPHRFRWRVWKECLKVDVRRLAVNYATQSVKPNAWTTQIEIDTPRTFPDLPCFGREHQQALLRVLNAYAAYNTRVGYCQGMNYVAGLLLLVSDMQEEESFAVLSCLMDNPAYNLSGFYRDKLPLLRRYLKACDKLVGEIVPDLRDHFIKENVQPAVYLHQWFLTLFISCFPLSMVAIIWDVIVCEGLPVVLRIAISILQVLKESLLTMSIEEIVRFFKMMKTHDDKDGELGAHKIGQLLMKHTEHVLIPDKVLEYLTREITEEEVGFDSDEVWEAELNGGTWLQSFSRMFSSFNSKSRRAEQSRMSNALPTARSEPILASGSPGASGSGWGWYSGTPTSAATAYGSAPGAEAATSGSAGAPTFQPAPSPPAPRGEDDGLTHEWQFL